MLITFYQVLGVAKGAVGRPIISKEYDAHVDDTQSSSLGHHEAQAEEVEDMILYSIYSKCIDGLFWTST